MLPRRPGGGESPADSIEAGLKSLGVDAGPNVRELSRHVRPGYAAIMEAAHVPGDWTEDAKASAVLTVIHELVGQIANPRWRATALAAFRLPAADYVGPLCDTRRGRWRVLAEREGTSPTDVARRIEDYRGYWTVAAVHLAHDLEDRLAELNSLPNGWLRYRIDIPPSPPRSLPISFDRTDVLYQLEGFRGIQCISYRWLTAHAPVDHYEAVGWYYNHPDAPVEVVPLANCTRDEPQRELPQGGVVATLRFSHVLEAGERYFFAYITRFNSGQPCRPTILWEVRGLQMRDLTVRAQFDVRALPAQIWYFDIGAQSEGWKKPDVSAPERLQVASNGYVDHLFERCERGRMYGLKWEWPR